ncbi:MAG TPA: hypothetical protein VMT27_05900 [Actinomycetes bacterium]|nr:hypothetical protein [Actinomycetes bacterium]
MRRWGPGALWITFTVVAVASGLLAVRLAGDSVTASSGPVLSAGEVNAQLKELTPAPTGTPKGHDTTASSPSANPTASPRPTKTEPTPSGSSTPTSGPTPTATKHASSGPQTATRTISSKGGSVLAECAGDSAFLRSWSPATGYRVDEVHRGPAAEVEIRFANSATEVTLTVRCKAGVPVGQQESQAAESMDDH